MAHRPFPFASLPVWSREELARTRRVMRAMAPERVEGAVRAGAVWAKLLDAVPMGAPGVPKVMDRTQVLAAHEGASLAVVGTHPTLGVVVALMDRAPALTLAARALATPRHEALSVGAVGELTPALEGALALLVARSVAVAVAPSPPPQVRGVTESVVTALDAIGRTVRHFVVWPWRYVVGTVGGTINLVATADLPAVVDPPAPWMLDRVRDLAVRVTVEVGRAMLEHRDVAGLKVGDMLSLDGLRAKAGGVEGMVDLAVGDPPTATASGTIVGSYGVEITGAVRPRRKLDMDDDDEASKPGTGVIAALGVEVVVEIARGTVPVGEIAAWRPGEVVTFGQLLGERVTVRAGGRVIARGELVDAAGEVGVKLTEVL